MVQDVGCSIRQSATQAEIDVLRPVAGKQFKLMSSRPTSEVARGCESGRRGMYAD